MPLPFLAARSGAQSSVFSGARARFKINGNYVGYATGCSGSEEIMYEEINVLDHLEVVEHVPIGYRVSFSASRVRLIGDEAGNNGSLRGALLAMPKLGQNDGEHLQNLLDMGDMQCTIEDTRTGKIFMTLTGVKTASHGWSVAARSIVGEDVTFVCIRAIDEAEQP